MASAGPHVDDAVGAAHIRWCQRLKKGSIPLSTELSVAKRGPALLNYSSLCSLRDRHSSPLCLTLLLMSVGPLAHLVMVAEAVVFSGLPGHLCAMVKLSSKGRCHVRTP